MRFVKIVLISFCGLAAAYNLRMLQLRMRTRQAITERFGHIIDHLKAHSQWVDEFGEVVTIERVNETYVHYFCNGALTYSRLTQFCEEYRPIEPIFGGSVS